MVNAQTNIAHIRLKLHENNINEVFEGHVVEVRSSLSLGLILFDQRIENITKN